MFSSIRKLFSSSSTKTVINSVEICFHKEANYFGDHGRLVVTNKALGLVEHPVRFAFKGITTPPKLTLELLGGIYEAAEEEGYIVHHLQSYGSAHILEEMSKVEQNQFVQQRINAAMTADEIVSDFLTVSAALPVRGE